MALPHAILVSLCEQASSGYELARRFDRSIGYFWTATHQQIYRTLRVMENNNWVRATTVLQHGRPDKKVYAISDSGRAELARWIAEPLSPTRPGRGSALTDSSTRDIAVKLRGAGYGDVARCIPKSPRCAPSVSSHWTPIAVSRSAPSQIRRRSMAPHCINTSCCAAESEPKKVPSIGSTK